MTSSTPTSAPEQDASAPSSDRRPGLTSGDIDRVNLESALRDFEIANARVVDLTSRLTLLNERVLSLQHENSMCRVQLTGIGELNDRIEFLSHERDSARAEAASLRASRSYRIGYKITRLLRKITP